MAERTRPDRHYVTLLFADLCRSTELAGAMEAELYGGVLSLLREACRTQVLAHGGMVVRMQGDGLLAMFGYPCTAEDDARRAVQAALALHAQVRDLPVQLPAGFQLRLHSGVHGGLVLIGDGDTDRGHFELMGPVPNIAARLCELAGPDQIVASTSSLGPAAAHFIAGPPRAARIRGCTDPVQVIDVVAAGALPRALAPANESHQAGFVGRDRELQALLEDLAAAEAGAVQVVAIAGAAGIGKTRLAQVLAERAASGGWLVLHGHCDQHAGAEPMQPFAQVLRDLPQVPPLSSPELAPLLARDTLAALARAHPVLLSIDDWQWADNAARQVLQGLARLDQCRMMAVVTTRDVDWAPGMAPGHRTVSLAPLADADAQHLASNHLPRVDPFVVADLCRHAGGNPLFVGELCHSLTAARLRDGSFVADVRQSPGAAPNHSVGGWLGQLIQSRVQLLPPVQAELVQAAAVIGNVVPGWLLEHLTGHGPTAPQVVALAERDLLYPEERSGYLRFKHGITRDVVYSSIEMHVRQLLHLRIAAALQHRHAGQPQGDLLESLAFHFEAGGDASLTVHYAELAGDRALAASALDRARAQYRAALAALDRQPLSAARSLQWIAIVQRLGLVSVYDPTRADLALVERALVLARQQPDRAVAARARYWVSYLHYGLGDAAEAVRHGEQALAEARVAGDDRLTFQIVATLGEAHTAAGDYRQALALLDEAIAVKRRHRSGRRTNVGLAFSLVCRAAVLGDRGQFADAIESFDEARSCVVGEEHEIGATIDGWRAAVLLWQGHWTEALAAATESSRIARGTRSLAQFSIASAMAGYARLMAGGGPGAVDAIEEATAWLAPRETGIFRSLNHGWLTEGQLIAGRRDMARRHAALTWRRARRGDGLGLAMSQRALALDDAAHGRPDAAQRRLAHAFTTARRRESAHELAATQLTEARLLLAAGGVTAARTLLDSAAAAFERMDMHWHLAQARWLDATALHADAALLLSAGPLPVSAAAAAVPARPLACAD